MSILTELVKKHREKTQWSGCQYRSPLEKNERMAQVADKLEQIIAAAHDEIKFLRTLIDKGDGK